MNPCPRCGREMELWEDPTDPSNPFNGWRCPATPDQHRIAALEKELEEAKTESVNRLARIVALEGLEARENAICPMCANSWMHTHSPEEVMIFKNGRKGAAIERDQAIASLNEALSERDAALAQVGELREALEFYGAFGLDGGQKAHKALSSTAATAQEWMAKMKAEWEKEVLARQPETAWLLERAMTPNGPEYLCIENGTFGWTTDNQKALRLARRKDGDALSIIVDDAWAIREHQWVSAAILGEKEK